MNNEKTLILDIEKFALHDGPGIRTVVFVKGCPLHCLWCHNPESQSFKAEVLFNESKCHYCGSCGNVCPGSCHSIAKELHTFDRKRCAACGACSEICPADALKRSGTVMSVAEVMDEVLKDMAFYQNSGGGLTLSGGEPLAHFAFTSALLKAAKESGVHTAIETCGFAPWEQIQSLLPLTDLWLWDVKAPPEKYKNLTGADWEPIHANLKKAAESGSNIVLRCPLVPDVNDEDPQLLRIAELANELGSSVQGIDLEPYHPLGEGKSRELGRNEIFKSEFVSDDRKKHWVSVISSHTKIPVRCF